MRVLFVVPPLTGHVNPTVSIAAALGAKGHQVAWAGHAERVAPLLPPGARLFDLGSLPAEVVEPTPRARPLRGLESLRFLWEDVLVPLARLMRPAVEAVVREHRPDVVVVDQQAVGGALALRRLGVPWATLCTTSAPLVDPLAAFPRVAQWLEEQLATLAREAELLPTPAPDLSPRLTLVLSTPALAGARDWPAAFRFVGPALGGRPTAAAFPWEALAPGRRVLISLGTVSGERGAAFYRAVVGAAAGAPWQVILVAPPALVPDAPANVLVRPRVPQLELLPHVHAVVTHAGHNTVCEALAHGLPLVCAPIRDDQPVVAGQVVAAGAGVRVRFAHLVPAALRGAIDRVLDEPPFAAAAARIATSFRDAGGAERAAELIVEAASV